METTGQGWVQLAELALAFVLALAIGVEREARQKSAGLRTYTLVGLGSALFVLISKYGFSDVLRSGVTLDPSRVAAQIVSGLGFLGAGLIFVRRDSIRGLTTAASVWLVAAVGAAAGAGLGVLAAFTTALYFLVMYGLKPLQRRIRRFGPNVLALDVTYLDGRGLLRSVINRVTEAGYVVEGMTADPVRTVSETPGAVERPQVRVRMTVVGRNDPQAMSESLLAIDGVVAFAADRAEV